MLGPFRKTCEISLDILRQNEDALMTILETFLHDPTTDFIGKKVRHLINHQWFQFSGILMGFHSAVPRQMFQRHLLVFWRTFATNSEAYYPGSPFLCPLTVTWMNS